MVTIPHLPSYNKFILSKDLFCYNRNDSEMIVTVHAHVPSNGICRGFAFKYGKFPLPPRYLTALSVPKVPISKQSCDRLDRKSGILRHIQLIILSLFL